MARQKMSPRQKMINMMYLVLLAMLALMVSPEVLDALAEIRVRLQFSALEATSHNKDFLWEMNNQIEDEIKNEGRMDNAGLTDTLAQIRSQTQSVLSALEQHIKQMEVIARFDPEQNAFTHMDEQESNYQYWMGHNEEANQRRGAGEARLLRDQLDAYFHYLAEIHNSQARADSEYVQPVLRKDPQDKEDPNKRWEQQSFEGPVMANLAMLEALKLDVLQAEKQLLERLNTRLGVAVFKPQKIFAISSPQARVVPAGTPFETQLSVGMALGLQPEFSSQNGRIAIGPDGTATLQVMANSNRIPAGQHEGTQTYTAHIRVPKATGGYEILAVQERFTVRKPEVVISSAAVQNLYRNCGNRVKIDVPALGSYYRPIVSAEGASVRASSQRAKEYLILPSGRRCVVKVSSRTDQGNMFIGEVPYNVISPPKPQIELKVNGRPYDGLSSVPKGSRFELRLRPDAEFKRLMPQDARYRIARVVVMLKDGLEPARPVKTLDLSGKNPLDPIRITMPVAVQQAHSGAKVFLKLEDLSRINYQGQAEALRLGELVETLPIQLR